MTRGEFCFLKHFCNCPCHGEIPLKKHLLTRYLCVGFPRFLPAHQLIGIKRPDVSEYMKENNPNFKGRYTGQNNPNSKSYKETKKIKAAVSKLEQKRLEAIVKEPVKADIKEPLKIDPNKKNILCPKEGYRIKICYRKDCKEYDFCHTVRYERKAKVVRTDYTNKIKELTDKYKEE